jgi:hypothetical protein
MTTQESLGVSMDLQSGHCKKKKETQPTTGIYKQIYLQNLKRHLDIKHLIKGKQAYQH